MHPLSIVTFAGAVTLHRAATLSLVGRRRVQAIAMVSFIVLCLNVRVSGEDTAYAHDSSGNQISRQVRTAGPPYIVSQPASQVVPPGESVGFAVVVADATELSYQWNFNDVAINGATGDSLYLTNITAANEGSYTVVITNPSGTVTSAPANLSLDIDRDDDGLPDAWEFLYFDGLAQIGSGDFDHDGVSNLDELLEGTNPASDASYHPRLTLTGVGGAVVASPMLPRYNLGQSVNLTATGDAGKYFHLWLRDLSGNANPTTIVMNAHKTVQAYFDEVITWGLNTPEQAIPANLANVVGIAAGDAFSVALKSDGTVVAWGVDNGGRTTVPPGLADVIMVAASYHTLALKSDGTVVAWGYNGQGQTNVPAGLNNVAAVAAGGFTSIALRTDGTVVGWGNNSYGQAVAPVSLNSVVAVAVGGIHTLALKADGTVAAWGNNGWGQTSVPAGLNDVIAIAAGESHSLALKADGTMVTWGAGQPVPSGLNSVVAIAAGGSRSLALKADGTVVSWGDGGFAQAPAGMNGVLEIEAFIYHNLALLDNPLGVLPPMFISSRFALGAVDRPFRYQVRAKNGVTYYSATGLPAGLVLNSSSGLITGVPTVGGIFTVAVNATNHSGTSQMMLTISINHPIPLVTSSNTAEAYVGSPFFYQLTGTNEPTSFNATGLPVGLNINPTTGVISGSTSAAPATFTISLTITNSYGTGTGTLTLRLQIIAGWGGNVWGERTIPPGLNNIVAIAGGQSFSLALHADGSVVGWGYNAYGQVTIPAGLNSVAAIAAGESHSLALKADGSVVGWGDNSYSQTIIPAGLNAVIAVAAGARHSLALRANGSVAGWGDDTYGQATSPTGLNDAIAIAAGGYHSLALRANGTVVAWGSSGSGQIMIPAGLDNVVAIAAGRDHSLALRANGTVVGWGSNGWGQITIPTGLGNVVAIAAGENHSLALRADGTVVGWGRGDAGQTTAPTGMGNVIAIGGGSSHSLALMNSLDAWKHIYWPLNPSGPDADAMADPDRDGIVNLTEYGLRMTPTQASVIGLPTVTLSGGFLQFTFTRARGELTYEVQESTDLLNWSTVATNPGAIGSLVTVPLPSGGPGKKFLRLNITAGP